MEFEISNINIIKKAKINIDGLTVIVGDNSSGKSTLARSLFSTIKALNQSDVKQRENSARKLQKYVDSLYKRLYSLNIDSEKIEELFPMPSQMFVQDLLHLEDLEEFILLRDSFIQNLDITPRMRELLRNDLKVIIIYLKKAESREWVFAAEIQNLIESEFINNINQTEDDESVVSFKMDEENKLKYSIKENSLHQSELNGNDFIQDATYIESPLYIHILDSLLRATNYKELSENSRSFRAMVPNHIIDFAQKIDMLKYTRNDYCVDFDFEKVIGGKFLYDTKSKKIIFKYGKKSVSPINVASGVKSFGVIQMLLEGGFIGPNKMLLWDEPENHLHPEWQLQFAELLVHLSKKGIPVVITTHSPYFLQAIRYYAEKHEITKYVNYYTSEIDEQSKLSTFLDVTDDLNIVFSKMAEPLNKIMNINELGSNNDNT